MDTKQQGWGQVVSISNTRIQYSRIDQSINLSTEGKNGGRDTSLIQKISGRIDRTDRKDTSTGKTVARRDITQYQKSQL